MDNPTTILLEESGQFEDAVLMARLCAKALDAGIEVEYVQELIRRRCLVPDNQYIYSEKWPWPLKIYTLGRFGIVKDGRHLLSNVQFQRKAKHRPVELLKAIIALGGEMSGRQN